LTLACALASACDSPPAPESRFVALDVAYTFVPPTGPPSDPSHPGSCAHHNAPANLRVRASWSSETVMFREAPGGVLRASLEARRGGQYWITFADIRLCGLSAPVVPATGVSVNEVALTRNQLPDGTYVFQFRVDTDGTVRP
jgi:hypothetical protein